MGKEVVWGWRWWRQTASESWRTGEGSELRLKGFVVLSELLGGFGEVNISFSEVSVGFGEGRI